MKFIQKNFQNPKCFSAYLKYINFSPRNILKIRINKGLQHHEEITSSFRYIKYTSKFDNKETKGYKGISIRKKC